MIPALERPSEGAELGIAQDLGDLTQAKARLPEVLRGRVRTDRVLDGLEGVTLLVKLPLQRSRRDAQQFADPIDRAVGHVRLRPDRVFDPRGDARLTPQAQFAKAEFGQGATAATAGAHLAAKRGLVEEDRVAILFEHQVGPEEPAMRSKVARRGVAEQDARGVPARWAMQSDLVAVNRQAKLDHLHLALTMAGATFERQERAVVGGDQRNDGSLAVEIEVRRQVLDHLADGAGGAQEFPKRSHDRRAGALGHQHAEVTAIALGGGEFEEVRHRVTEHRNARLEQGRRRNARTLGQVCRVAAQLTDQVRRAEQNRAVEHLAHLSSPLAANVQVAASNVKSIVLSGLEWSKTRERQACFERLATSGRSSLARGTRGGSMGRAAR